MATSSEVKTGLDDISAAIRAARQSMVTVKGTGASVSADLGGLATEFADLIATVNAYGTTNAFEALAKAELGKLTAEFTALKAVSDAVAAINLG